METGYQGAAFTLRSSAARRGLLRESSDYLSVRLMCEIFLPILSIPAEI